MRSSSNRKEGCRVASPLSPRSVEATESALGLLPSIALSSAQFLLIIRVVRWRSLTAAGRSGAPSQLLRESNQQRKHNSGKGCAGRAHIGQHARSGIVSSHFRNRGPLASGAGRTQAGDRRGPHLLGSRSGCDLVVPRMFRAQPAVRSSAGTVLASPRHLSVSDHFACQPAAYLMRPAGGESDQAALGGSGIALHRLV